MSPPTIDRCVPAPGVEVLPEELHLALAPFDELPISFRLEVVKTICSSPPITVIFPHSTGEDRTAFLRSCVKEEEGKREAQKYKSCR